MRLPRFPLAMTLVASACAFGATFEERVELFFRPPLAEQMALSTDGKHVAYTLHEGTELQVILLNVDNPRSKLTVNVDEARSVAFSKEKHRAQLRFLRWASADRLVIAPTAERIQIGDHAKIIAPIMAVDANGQNAQVLVDADEFSVEQPGAPEDIPIYIPRSPLIVGFEPGNREELVLQLPQLGRTTPAELVLLNVRTGNLKGLDYAEVRGTNDGRLRVEPALRREIDAELARKFPQRHVAVLDWSEGMQHVLVRVTGGNDPGRVFVYQRPVNMVLELFRVAPWLKSANLHASRFLEVPADKGARLSGYLTWPRTPRLKPPPLLVFFPNGFPGRPQPDYDAEAQAFAELGFAVLRLNHRYAQGIPVAERDVARATIDRISVDDAAAMIRHVAAQFPERVFDVKHVAALGRGFGGYLAVRALQLRPDAFRAGIAIDAPTDLHAWLEPVEGAPGRDIPRDIFAGDTVAWAKLSVRDNVETLKHPVYFLVEPTRNRAIDDGVAKVRTALTRLKRPADYFELDPAFSAGLPKTRAAVYRKIEEFLNLHLYDYRVKIGPATEVK